MAGDDYQPGLLHPSKLLFQTDGKIKAFSDKHKLSQFMTMRLALQNVVKGIIYSRGGKSQLVGERARGQCPTSPLQQTNQLNTGSGVQRKL